MRLIGVIDLAGGRAVHARGGQRERYAPVQSALLDAADAGDPIALARGYMRLPVTEIYLADLDAIGGAAPSIDTIQALTSLGATLWVDAGQRASEVAAAGQGVHRAAVQVPPTGRVAHIVVGLETMQSWADLEGLPGAAFSLDLRAGRPLYAHRLPGISSPVSGSPTELARRAVDAGATAVILLDLVRVGSMAGLDWVTVDAVRASTPGVELVVGGGVRDENDLKRLASAGCDAALVATALHEQRIRRVIW